MNNIETYTAIIATLIAMIALYIACQQLKTNRRIARREHYLKTLELQFQLYDKRYMIYFAAVDFVKSMLIKGRIIDDAYWEFKRKTQEIPFLFGDDIKCFFDKIIDKAVEITRIEDELDCLNSNENEKRKRILKHNKYEIRKWFSELNIEAVFMNYLNFNDFKHFINNKPL